MNGKYNEIMDLPHHVSGTRPQMAMSDRAVHHRSDHEGTQLDYRVLNEAVSAVRSDIPLGTAWEKRIEEDFESGKGMRKK
jgi:hypothetical protein